MDLRRAAPWARAAGVTGVAANVLLVPFYAVELGRRRVLPVSLGSANDVGSLNDSLPLRPSVPEARNIISAPTFASRLPRSRIVPFESPTVNTISKTPTAMPSTLTNVRAGRWSIFEKTRLSINCLF